jgi:hypothetical protein
VHHRNQFFLHTTRSTLQRSWTLSGTNTKMKPSQFSLSSISLFLLAVSHTAKANANGKHNQQPIILNPFEPTAVYRDVPTTTLATSASSTATCDFPPMPTGCAIGDMAPFPFNCTKFFMCVSWGPLMQSCPNGTVFDFKKEKCLMTNETSCTGCCKTTDCDPK